MISDSAIRRHMYSVKPSLHYCSRFISLIHTLYIQLRYINVKTNDESLQTPCDDRAVPGGRGDHPAAGAYPDPGDLAAVGAADLEQVPLSIAPQLHGGVRFCAPDRHGLAVAAHVHSGDGTMAPHTG